MKKIICAIFLGAFAFLMESVLSAFVCPLAYFNVFAYVILISAILMAIVPFTRKQLGIPIVFLAILLFAVPSYCMSGAKAQENAENHQKMVDSLAQSYQNDYDKALEILSKNYVSDKDYETASNLLLKFRVDPKNEDEKQIASKFPYGRILAEYANAMKDYTGHDQRYAITQYETALRGFDAIPQDYDGPLADTIAKNRLRVKKDYEETKGFVEGAAREAAAERAANIDIGESEAKITKVLGQPQKVNTTKTTGGTRKQYVYGDGRYVYTTNGVITGMQNIEHQY